jgi:hypothetical protein
MGINYESAKPLCLVRLILSSAFFLSLNQVFHQKMSKANE